MAYGSSYSSSTPERRARRVRPTVRTVVKEPVKTPIDTEPVEPTKDNKSTVTPYFPVDEPAIVVVSEDTISTARVEDLTEEEIQEQTGLSIPEGQIQTQSELERQSLTYIRGLAEIEADERAVKDQKASEKLEEYNVKKQEYDKCLSELKEITNENLRKQKQNGCDGLKNIADVSFLIYQNFTNTKAQPLAPPGYHQMADGSLMADVEHAAHENLPKCSDSKSDRDGFVKADKAIITDFDFDYSDISGGGETRFFTVSATNGSIFSLEIKSSAGKHYNFNSNSFTTAYASLKNTAVYGAYSFSVVFPSTSAPITYDIFLIAQDGASHAAYTEVLFDDNTIDLNSSTGSNSSLLHKRLHQVSAAANDLTYELTAKSPNSVANLSDHASITGLSKKKSTILDSRTTFEFSVTSGSTKAYQILKQPTSEDIFVEVTRTIGSAPVFIEGEDVSSSTHYSWPLDNIHGIGEDMIPIGTNVTADSVVKYHQETVASLSDTPCAYETLVSYTEPLIATSPPTLTRKSGDFPGVLVTTQLGNVTFDKQQAAALADDEIKFLAYGPAKIKELTGWELEFVDLKVELTAPTTTTTQATVNLTTVTIASGDGIADDVSTVSGIGITGDGASAPKVTNIGSYSGTTATITFDSAQTLENGTTLTFHDAGETITISGSVIFKTDGKTYGTNYELPNWDGKFYFDLEKFITPTAEAS